MYICEFFCLILVHTNTLLASMMYNLMYQLQYSSIKFCSYNFMLNQAPNNTDIAHVTNIVLNKVPNSSNATPAVNNVHLTSTGAQQFLMAAIQLSCRKADLPKMSDNNTITIKVQVRNKLCPGKEWRLYTYLVVQAVGRSDRQ